MVWPAWAVQLVWFIVALLVSTAINYLLAEDFDQPDIDYKRGVRANTRSTKATLPLLFGIVNTGVNIVYIGTTGEDNKYMHIVGTVGEGPIEGFYQVDAVDQLYLDGKIWTDYGADYIDYELFTGTATQDVCEMLNLAIPEFTDPMRYTAYIYVRLKYDKEIFQKKPDITMILKGLKCYDPELDSTAYTNNPCIATHEAITRTSIRGGMGVGLARMDATSFSSTKSYCVGKGWTTNMPIYQQQAIADNIQLLINCYRGAIVYSGNKFHIKFKDLNYEAVTNMTFDEDSILRRGDGESSVQIKPKSNLFGTPNAIKASFHNEEKEYKEDEFVFPDSVAIANDGDYRERIVKLMGLSSIEAVQKMCYYLLERWRWGNAVSMETFSKALRLEPHDLVRVTHGIFGWTDQIMRVIAPSVGPGGEVSLSLIEEKSELYDDIYNPAPANQWHAANLPDIDAPVLSVANVSQREELYNFRKRSYTRWHVNFDRPDPSEFPFWDYAEIWAMVIDMDTIANDESVNSNNGSLEGTANPTLANGIWGKCLSFDGVNSRVDCGNGVPLDVLGAGDFSISFWMQSSDTIVNYGALFSKYEDASNRIHIRSVATNDQLEFRYEENTIDVSTVFTDINPFDEEWNHIVVTVNRTTDEVFAYMNSVKSAVEGDISSLPATAQNYGNVSWGAKNDGTSPYEGKIDECRIYDSVLTATHIDDLYNLRDISRTNLIGYWPFGRWDFRTKSEGDYVFDPVNEGVRYYCKMQSVSIFKKKESFNAAYTVDRTIQGKTSAPSSMSTLDATVSSDNVYFQGTEINDPDIVGYEFRIADVSVTLWSAATYVGFNVKPTYNIGGMRSGNYKMFCKAKGNNGLYSDDHVSDTFQVFVPTVWTLDQSFDVDQPDGSHSNTQYIDQGGGDYALRINHSGGLTGIFTTPEFDLGSKKIVRVEGDFITKVIESSKTIGSMWPSITPIEGTDILFTDGSATVTCTGADGEFIADLSIGSLIRTTSGWIGDYVEVQSITNDDVLVLTAVFSTVDGSNVTGSVEKQVASPPALNTYDLDLTFSELFDIDTASIISATLYWDDDSGAPYTHSANLFELIAITAEGRYFQVEVLMEDPNYDQYLMLDGSGSDTVLTVDFYV